MKDHIKKVANYQNIEKNRNWASNQFGFETVGKLKRPIRFFGPLFDTHHVLSIAHHEYHSMFCFQGSNKKSIATTATTATPIEYNMNHDDFKILLDHIKNVYLKKAQEYTGEISNFKPDRYSQIYM